MGPMLYGIMWLLMSYKGLYIIRHDQLGFSLQITRGKGGKINNIHNVVNNKITEFNHGGCSWV